MGPQRFGPFSLHFEIDQQVRSTFHGPLNLTRHGMSKSFVELLIAKIAIVNTKRLENEQIQVGNIQNFGPLKFLLDPLNLGFAVPRSGKFSWTP